MASKEDGPSGQESPSQIEVRNLCIKRSGELIIDDANFDIKMGDYIGMVGPNGGGKTTLIQAILGMLPVESGEIRLFGKPFIEFSDWEKIGYISQHAINFDNLFPITVRELVGLGRVTGKNIARPLSKTDWDCVDEALEFMNVRSLADKRIGGLSGGQKQRVFVAKAIVRNPELLILDEPVAGIDTAAEAKFYEILGNLNIKRKTTILLASHDLSVVFCRMSRIMCVNRKVLTSDVTPNLNPEELLRDFYGPHFHFVFHKHECEGEFKDGRP